MSEKIKVNFQGLNDKTINQFALQQVFRNAGISYEYQFGEQWIKGPPQAKPDGKRAVFDSIDSFRVTREVYFAWDELTRLFGKEQPVYPEEILQRFTQSFRLKQPLILFIPWGFRYNGSFGDKEKTAMDIVDIVKEILSARSIPNEVLLMPADLYAKEINDLNPLSVDTYFCEVRQAAEQRGYQIRPWSLIRSENARKYNRYKSQLTKKAILESLPSDVVEGALDAARRRSGKATIKEKEGSAFDYLRERLCEAMIIEEIFRPIKISMVSKRKDKSVDVDLPRLYILPEKLQFPWL